MERRRRPLTSRSSPASELLGSSQLGTAFSKETIDFDYCIIAAGCNFGPFHKPGGPVATYEEG